MPHQAGKMDDSDVPVLSYRAGSHAPKISVFSAFAGAIIAGLLAVLAIVVVAKVCDERVIRRHMSRDVADAITACSIGLAYVLGMLWIAWWYHRKQDTGFSIGVLVGMGISAMLLAASMFT